MKKHGHKIKDLALKVAKILRRVDAKRLLHVADQLPNYMKCKILDDNLALHLAEVYLASLGEVSRQTMREALNTIIAPNREAL